MEKKLITVTTKLQNIISLLFILLFPMSSSSQEWSKDVITSDHLDIYNSRFDPARFGEHISMSKDPKSIFISSSKKLHFFTKKNEVWEEEIIFIIPDDGYEKKSIRDIQLSEDGNTVLVIIGYEHYQQGICFFENAVVLEKVDNAWIEKMIFDSHSLIHESILISNINLISHEKENIITIRTKNLDNDKSELISLRKIAHLQWSKEIFNLYKENDKYSIYDLEFSKDRKTMAIILQYHTSPEKFEYKTALFEYENKWNQKYITKLNLSPEAYNSVGYFYIYTSEDITIVKFFTQPRYNPQEVYFYYEKINNKWIEQKVLPVDKDFFESISTLSTDGNIFVVSEKENNKIHLFNKVGDHKWINYHTFSFDEPEALSLNSIEMSKDNNYLMIGSPNLNQVFLFSKN